MGSDGTKITDLRTFHCSDDMRNAIFLQVHTDEGIVGVGEPYTIGPDETPSRAI